MATTDSASTTSTNFPTCVNHLIHGKMNDGEEVIMFPYTTYDNILGKPCVVTDLETFPGAPFFFYENETIEVADATIEALYGIKLTEDDISTEETTEDTTTTT